MSGPVFIQYLLKLATDAEELQRYRDFKKRSGAEFNNYLTSKVGLTAAQAEALLKNDSRRVLDEVLDELAKNNSRGKSKDPFYGVGVTFMTEYNHIEDDYTQDSK